MSYVIVPGASPLWVPYFGEGLFAGQPQFSSAVDMTLDADEEELQFIGTVVIDGGGSKTFGTSGSKIDWLPGGSITFADDGASDPTLTIGVKKASQIDTANGPAARATIGAAAFDVYDTLVGGTDTITTTTWRSDTMSAGTPFTVTNGDLIAICWHLDKPGGAAQNVKVRSVVLGTLANFPVITLVTSGPTYTAQSTVANFILTFDDGTLGWLESSRIFTVADTASATIGNTNIYGNILELPFNAKIDALAAVLSPSTNDANFSLCLYSTPLGTPNLLEAISFDANVLGASNQPRSVVGRFLSGPYELVRNTAYVIGIRQDTATAMTVQQQDVASVEHHRANTLDEMTYAANSTAAATFAAQNSGKRRYLISARISHIDDGAGGGGSGLARIIGG